MSSNASLLQSEIRGNYENNAFEGIEDITYEMPSRTIGRQRSRYLERMLTDDQFFEQTRERSTVRRRFQTPNHSDVISDNNEVIQEEVIDDFEKIQCGDIRELPFSMNFKRNLRERFRSNGNCGVKAETRQKSKNRKWQEFKRKVVTFFTIWSSHLKKIEGNFGSGVTSYFLFLRGLFFLSVPSFILSFCFTSLPQLIENPEKVDSSITFTGEELLTGSNWLSDTIMYYGHYVNGTISPNNQLEYNMPVAYLLAILFYFIVCLVWLFRETATNFRMSYIETTLDSMHFCNKIFCSWNYGIVSKQNANLLHKSIFFDLKEVLAETKISSSPQGKSGDSKCKIFFKRAFIWVVWAAFTGGCVAFVYYLNQKFLPEIKTGSSLFDTILLALFVSTVNLLIPYFFIFITHKEDYKNPRNEIFVSVFRIFFLKIGMLAAICAFWTQNITKEIRVACWETRLGEEVYRLVLFDFIFSILFSTIVMEFFRRIVAEKSGVCKKAIFQISINVLDLIYGQTLCWIGIFFSPILSLIVIIKYVLLFYIKKMSVLSNCRPSKRRWRAQQSRTCFNALLLLSFFISFGFIGYVVYSVKPSTSCGPFRGLSNSYSVITDALWDLAGNEWIAIILSIIFSVWFIFGIVLALFIYTIFIRSRTLAKKNLTERLKDQILLEGADKSLLLEWMRSISDPTKFSSTNNPLAKLHRVPQLIERHRDSINARPSHAPSSGSNYHARELDGGADVQMTHVDPQHVHVNADHSQSPRMFRRKPEHTDPMVTRAFNNQVRPVSYYQPENHDEFDYGMRQYSQSVSQPRYQRQKSPLERAMESKRANQQRSATMAGNSPLEDWDEERHFGDY